MTQQTRLQILLEELKRRRVFRVATLYLVITWPIIQIADILSPALNMPQSAMQTLLIVFIAGFPIALTLAWIFMLTPKGLVKVEAIDADNKQRINQRLIGKKTEVLIIGSLLLITLGLFIFQSDLTSSDSSSDPVPDLTANVENKQIDSIAVLPFVPFSENKQDEYFADGLSEELLNVLAKIDTLRVVARTSSFIYKGVNKSIQQVGAELGVDVILEGSVRRNDVDNTIRVTAQLIDVNTGTHLWSETYDRQFNDVFRIQDEISAAVVRELKNTILNEQQLRLLTHETSIPEAMVAHSMGRTELAKRTAVGISQAMKYFDRAIIDDPQYATAYASLAEANILQISYADKPEEEAVAKAQVEVDKALAIDPNHGLAWAAQGLIYMSQKGKMEEAIKALEKAIKLNPSYAMANMWYGSLQKDMEKRIKYHKKALKLDPKSAVAGYNVGTDLVKLGRDSEAMDVFSQIVEANPFYPNAYILVAEISQNQGRMDQAIIQYQKAYELGKRPALALNIAQLYSRIGDTVSSREWMLVVSKDAPDSFKIHLRWLEISNLLAENKRDKAKVLLTEFLSIESPDADNYYNAVIASYWLQDYPETIRQFELAAEVKVEQQDNQRWEKKPSIPIEGQIYATYAYQQVEQLDKRKELSKIIYSRIDEIASSGKRITADIWYFKSLLQEIDGEHQKALITLQRAIDEGWVEPFRIKAEPILQNLKNNKNFRAMLTGLDAKMILMRDQLMALSIQSRIVTAI